MALSSNEILRTILLGMHTIATSAKAGVTLEKAGSMRTATIPRTSRVTGFIHLEECLMWANGLEVFRWSLVACGFIFVLFGFVDEMRQLYRRV